MITREQITAIITQALKADAHDDSSASVFAQQLATALDALGLIQFCDINEPEALDLDPRGDTIEQANPERRNRSADR